MYTTKFDIYFAIIRAYVRGTTLYSLKYLIAIAILSSYTLARLCFCKPSYSSEILYLSIKTITFISLIQFYLNPTLFIKMYSYNKHKRTKYYKCKLTNIKNLVCLN